MVGARKGWVDTSLTPPILKVRTNANDGWLALGASSGGSGGGHIIMDLLEVALTQRDTLMFEGTTVQVYDDPVNLRTVVRSFSTGIMTVGDPEDPSMVLADGTFVMVEYFNG